LNQDLPSDTAADDSDNPLEQVDQGEAYMQSVRFRCSLDDALDLPYALVKGEAFNELPKDLFIPPEALEIVLDQFEGPLDLLLYLIRKQNLDILEVNVSLITQQYMSYIDMMQALRLELAAEYLVMAAMLAEIKSRMLLPRSQTEEEAEEGDPRAELIRRLLEYERFKEAAEALDEQPRLERDLYVAQVQSSKVQMEKGHPDVSMKDIMLAFAVVLKRSELFEKHEVIREKLSTRERMSFVLANLQGHGFVPFISLFKLDEGRMGVVVTFLAILELVKEQLVDLVQSEVFAPIHVKARVQMTDIDAALSGVSVTTDMDLIENSADGSVD
jgi:segregation and condensation protein A